VTSYILAPRLFDGERFYDQVAVALDGERIIGLRPAAELPGNAALQAFEHGTLAPGFIDIQVNGGGGVLLNNDPSMETVERMAAGHRRAGTTGLLPTLISDTPETQRAAVAAVVEARARGNRGVLGVHIEGPFFEPARRGTHRADMIRGLTDDDLAWLTGLKDLPVLLTLAPERLAPGQLRCLADAGIRVFAGHTDASYEQISAALAEGLHGFTHLFNAMSPLTGRAPGTVGAALDHPDCWAGIIADGHHVHPASIRIAQCAKPRGKLLLVSDAMATVGSDDDSFEIYGERIALRDGKLVNAEGALAGSAIGLNDAVRYTHTVVGLPLNESLRMASLYPAACLGLDNELGRIAPDHRADLVLFDDNLRVHGTWVAGEHQAH
jgi:N-acetylglucosamine-6-phosphate deacetylase